MNKKLFNVLLFTTGAAIGSLVTWKVVKTRYERIIQEEIDSFKETYALCMGSTTDTHASDEEELVEEEDDDEYETSVMTDYAALAGKYGRSSEKNNVAEEGGGDDEVPYIDGPYIIEPKDFGDGNYDHELHCINYYADGILADDWGVILDIEETIGEDALNHFGEYAEDVIHVRNKRLQIDYEVACDPRTYADVMKNDPLMAMHAD